MKVKLHKRFYTVEQLAARWECTAEDITHLIEIGELQPAHRLAAVEGKRIVKIIPCPDMVSALESPLPDMPDYYHAVTCCPKEGQTFDPDTLELETIEILRAEGSLEKVITADDVSRFEREHGDTKTPTGITARTQTTYLNIIGGLVSLLLGKSPNGKPHSVFENQAAVIDALLSEYGHVKGMGDSNLEKILARAKKELKNSLIPGG